MEKTYSKEEKRALAITIKSLEKSLNKLEGEVKNINTTTKGLFEYHKEKKDIKIRQMIVHLPLIIFIYDYPTGI